MPKQKLPQHTKILIGLGLGAAAGIVAHLGGSGKEITDIVEGIFKGVPKKKRAERKYMDTENNRHGREC
ncbi:MAG: hypothetical protein L0209_02370, partial [candidate division Zixibacteria bacterium]|nr:hypothetical protein [candidate division Zixibacteria bacterium]